MILMIPFYLLLFVCFASSVQTEFPSLPGCPRKCGNLTVPFPFGMTSECSFDESFVIICDRSFEPPKAFLRQRREEVIGISLDGKLELLNSSTVEWAVGNVDCHVARRYGSHNACRSAHSQCTDSRNGQGHICRCLSGYQGNPYLADGCKGVDHCSVSNPCVGVGVCINLPGSFKCDCPKGLIGDGRKNGSGCHTQDEIHWSASVLGIFVVAPLLVGTWIVHVGSQKKQEKLRREWFKKNGGELLQRKLSRHRSPPELRIYTEEDVKRITNRYNDRNVMLGCRPGDFYRGSLPSGFEVAVVMVGRVAESHIDQFVDQLVFLSQPHRNLVRILGCCLETESPFVVYELHGDGSATLFDERLSCEYRLKAAAGVARGLAYLNSHKFKTTFVHGSICSGNILMNDNSHDAKIFYAAGSNLITRVPDQENYVYLDPKARNKKSDVYSFGVVLVKLLTGGRAISPNRGENDRTMALNFVFLAKVGRLGEILDEEMAGGGEAVKEVAALAERCLNVRPDKRPDMKEVSAKLNSLILVA